jgi:hypothetical protein
MSDLEKQAALEQPVWEYDASSGQYIQDPNVLRPGKGYWVYPKGEYRVVIMSEPLPGDRGLYNAFVDASSGLSCKNQAGNPDRDGIDDKINIVFMNSDSAQETLRHFEDHVGWHNRLGDRLCAYSSNELRPHDEQRASDAFATERWHVRFFHDSKNRRTLAAVHYDECNAGEGLGSVCTTFHHGIRFDESRDALKGAFDFEKAGHIVAVWDEVLYVTIK